MKRERVNCYSRLMSGNEADRDKSAMRELLKNAKTGEQELFYLGRAPVDSYRLIA